MQTKKIPMRLCTGCGEMKPKKELVRVVKSPDGNIDMDLTGKKSGRGAYVCRDIKCLRKARKARRIAKSFACQIPDDVYDKLERQLEQDE